MFLLFYVPVLLAQAPVEPPPGGAAPPPAAGEAAPPSTGGSGPPSGDPGPSPGPPGMSADAKGIVVRLTSSGPIKPPVVVTLQAEGGEPISIQLKDNGSAPDVIAGDGTWSAAGFSAGDAFTGSLEASGATFPISTVRWPADQRERDLTLQLDGGAVAATATKAEPKGEEAPSASSGPPPTGTPGEGSLQSSAPPMPNGTPPLAQTSEDATLYVLLGVGLLLLAGLGYWWYRGGSAPSSELPRGVSLVPGPGLFGPGTPGPGEYSEWTGDDPRGFYACLLAALARHHRVLVRVPARGEVPAVPGGPVFRIEAGPPADFGEAVEDLREIPGSPLVLLLLGDGLNAATLKAHLDLVRAGTGVFVLTREPLRAGATVARYRRVDDGWEVSVGERQVRVPSTM